jgi:hypothetical protein
MKLFREVTDTWVVDQTTTLFGLKLADGATITAPAGKQVTMTYNGDNVPILPGTYEGDIVLTVTEDIAVHAVCDAIFRAALYVDGSHVVPEKSVLSAVVGGETDDTQADGITIRSREDNFNGVYVDGDSHYTLRNAEIQFQGNGDNDFIGQGACVMAGGNATLTVDHCHITTHGAARGTLFGGQNGTLLVNDSVIEARAGVLPPDYVDSIEPGGMRCVPWQLGLRGNCRATNLADSTTAHFTRCQFRSESWGVLSTDGVDHVRSYVEDCDIRITGSSGYGAFALLDTEVTLDHSTITVPDYGLVSSMGPATFLVKNGTVIRSGRFGAMSYRLVDGLVKVDPGCSILTGETTFLTKGCPITYDVDGATLQSDTGVIVQVMDTDDPFNPIGSYSDPVDDEQYIEGRDLTKAVRSEDCFAKFSNMTVNGDIFNASSDLKFEFIPLKPLPGEPGGPPLEPLPDGTMPKFSKMMGNGPMNLAVDLKNATLNGRITAAKALHRVPKIDKRNCEELGEVINTPRESINNGVIVTLDATSVWAVPDTCYLTKLVLAPGAKVIGTDGRAVQLSVDGIPTPLASGEYVGKLQLTLA